MMCLGRVGRIGGGSNHISFQRSVMAFSGRDRKTCHNNPVKIQTRQLPKSGSDTTLLDPTCSVYYRISNVCIIPKTTLF
jgi:hypothetical protein